MEIDKLQKPDYIEHQENHNCQQFFGPVTGCIFAMPGSNVTSQTPQASQAPIEHYEAEAQTKKSRGPKKNSLFRNERGQKDEVRTQAEAERIKAYTAEHHLGNTCLDSSIRSKLNKVVATFWQRWEEYGYVNPELEGAPFYRFLTEDCGIKCPVDEKAFIRAVRSIIYSGEIDPEIYDNVAIFFENN